MRNYIVTNRITLKLVVIKIGIFKKNIKNELQTSTGPRTFTIQELNDFFDNSEILSAIGKSNLTAATYYACMLIRCNALAKIPFKIYRQRGDETQLIKHVLGDF